MMSPRPSPLTSPAATNTPPVKPAIDGETGQDALGVTSPPDCKRGQGVAVDHLNARPDAGSAADHIGAAIGVDAGGHADASLERAKDAEVREQARLIGSKTRIARSCPHPWRPPRYRSARRR